MYALQLEGWLQKQGVKGMVKGWKKRWFVLFPGEYHINYYQTRQEVSGLVPVDNVHRWCGNL